MKKLSILIILVIGLLLLSSCSLDKADTQLENSEAINTADEKQGQSLIIHYFRYDEDYKNWSFWIWSEGKDGKAYQITSEDDFGKIAEMQLEEGISRVGIIPRLGDWEAKDINMDRFIDLKGEITEVWMIQGTEEIFYDRSAANTKPKVTAAYLDSKKDIVVELSAFIPITGNNNEGFIVKGAEQSYDIKEVKPLQIKQESGRIQGYETLVKDTKIQFVFSPSDMGYRTQENEKVYVLGDFNNYKKSDEYEMEFDSVFGIYKLTKDIGKEYPVQFNQGFTFAVEAGGKEVYRHSDKIAIDKYTGKSAKLFQLTLAKEVELTTNLYVYQKDFMEGKVALRKVLEMDEFVYTGNDLGANYTGEYTVFKVWSPLAQNMKTVIYSSYSDDIGKEYPMLKAQQGVWELQLKGDYRNQYYNYRVTINSIEKETPDPYAKGATANGKKGMIADISALSPEGWENHKMPTPVRSTEAVLYEMHVRDFSVDENSGIKNKGKFLAFTEKGTKGPQGVSTGLDHLKELGITHLHLLPVYDFASIDETREGQYNWGYDPYLYNVPEGSYSTNPYDGAVRILEFKEMVKSLHENNIRVVMDVVYNHTYTTGDSPFDVLMPKYYYRTDASGRYSNGSGCGNETASEKPMMRKFIVDSVKFWATEYKIDGFRFDLMALHDIDTMKEVESELRKINPDILIYGEPWTGGTSALSPALQLRKGIQKGMNIAVFNDDIRNAIKGDNDGVGLGFANGSFGLESEVKKGIVGSINYSDKISSFTERASESINYVSSHDNLALFDKFELSNPSLTPLEREKMNRLALSIVLTSEGIPFIQGGTEILRTKQGNHNSYKAGDSINKIDWDRKNTYSETYNYIKDLIEFRRSQKVFSLDKSEDIKKSLSFIDAPHNTVAYTLKSSLKGDFKNILVIHNANRKEASVKLPLNGDWTVVANEHEVNKAGVSKGKSSYSDEVSVAPLSTYILIKNN